MSQKHITIAKKFLQQKFPKADCAFVSGSIIRGEGKKHSDLDIVVLFSTLTQAFRESFIYESTPIEVFVHDPQTIHWFISDGKKKGIADLAHMISTGVVVPKITPLSKKILNYANHILKEGPAIISKDDLLKLQYSITDIIDDLRDERPQREKIACAVKLYPLLAEVILRNKSNWLADSKWIPRKLKMADAELAEKFDRAFQTLFTEGKTKHLINLASEILNPIGGFYWEGWYSKAPKKWRKKFR